MDKIVFSKIEAIHTELLILKSKLELIGMDHNIPSIVDRYLWDASATLTDVVNDVKDALNAL